ncbi:MAG: PAS domain S-box protein [Thermoplasmata archaeon]|nr:MAG: PAS domain S-box protein [Thermoplasmata archaeon]
MKLRYKFLIIVIIVSLAPLLSIGYVLINESATEIREKTEEGLLNLVKAKSKYYDEQLQTLRIDLEKLAEYISSNWGRGNYYNKSYIWISPDGKGYENYIEDMKNFEMIIESFRLMMYKNDKISLAYFGMENGLCFLSDPNVVKKLFNLVSMGEKFDHRERIWYTLAKEKNRTVWSPLYIDVNTGMLVTTVSSPVYVNEKFMGVVGMDLLLDTLKNDILDIKFADSGYSLLVGRDGYILVHPEYTEAGKSWNESFEEKNIFNISGLSEIGEEIKNSSVGLKIIKLEGEKSYAVFSPIEEINGSLVFILPEKVIMESVAKTIKEMALIVLFISVGITLIAFLFSRHITAPIENLQKATKEVALGNLDRRVEVKGKDEVADLARDFNKMVAELRMSNKALKESEEKYRGLFEESTDAIYISTEDGKLLDINEAGEKLFGYTKEELRKMNVENLYENKEDRNRFKKEIEKKGFVKDYEVRLKRKDGKIIDCLLSSVKIEKDGKVFYQGIIRDVTEIKRTRKQLEMYNSLLRHDISNRSQISLGCLELLRETPLNEEQRKLVDKALGHLIYSQQLLQKLSIINKAGEKRIKKVNLDKAIKRGIESYEHIAKEKGIKINYDGKKAFVLANELLENVFSNLIENAINHADCKNIDIYVRENGDEYIITVKDDGEGVPDEIRDKLFEWGTKGKDSKGSGLGLHLVKIIVEGYGGRIMLKDAEKGAVFEIYLKKADHL